MVFHQEPSDLYVLPVKAFIQEGVKKLVVVLSFESIFATKGLIRYRWQHFMVIDSIFFFMTQLVSTS